MKYGWRYHYIYLSLLFGALLILSFFVIQPYIVSVLMALIAANFAHPLYVRILPFVKQKQSAASFLTLLFLCLCFILPLLYFISIASTQAIEVGNNFYSAAQNYIKNPDQIPPYLQSAIQYLSENNVFEKISGAIGKLGNFLLSSLGSIGNMTFNAILKIFIFLYSIFFFLQDDGKLVKALTSYIPLPEKDTKKILTRVDNTVKATIKGTIIIGFIQGTLAGIGFWIAGIPGAIFWWLIMIILSAVPVLGAPLIWIPACIFLAVDGDVTTAAILALYCGLIVGNIDNLIRPRLVGKNVGIHEVLVLISTLGGITFFWISGFILGPAIIACFLAIGEEYKEDIKKIVSE